MKRNPTVLTLLLTLLLAAPLHAYAAPVAPLPSLLPVVHGTGGYVPRPRVAQIANIDIQVWPEDPTSPTGATIIVVAQLATATPMPATVRMPLPAGAKIGWSGEVFQSAGSSDVQRPFTTETPAGDIVAITTQKSRIVQYEASYPTFQTKSGRRIETLQWVQSAPADSVTFSFKLPIMASDVRSQPTFVGAPDVNQAGEKLYAVPARVLQVGSKFQLSVDYVVRSAVTPTASQSDLLLPILLGLLAVAVVALVLVAVRKRRTAE